MSNSVSGICYFRVHPVAGTLSVALTTICRLYLHYRDGPSFLNVPQKLHLHVNNPEVYVTAISLNSVKYCRNDDLGDILLGSGN